LNEPVQLEPIEKSSDRSSHRGIESAVSVSVNSAHGVGLQHYSKSGFFFLVQSIIKDLFLFQPGLIHTSQSLREGLVKILQSKK
jgi:hypothetical protein